MAHEVVELSEFLDRGVARRRSRKLERKAARTNPTAKPVTKKADLVPRTARQAGLLAALAGCDQVFSLGPEGTGKTYILGRWAIRQVLDGRKDVLVIARPAVAKAKHRMGFLPGNADEKTAPWLIPLMDAFKDECSAATIDRLKTTGKIVYAPFETLRGRTFRNAVMILDEAQNCDLSDLRLFLTRPGENTQVLVNGSFEQVGDIPDSGLRTVVDMVVHHKITAVVVTFLPQDVVRSGIVREWVAAFSASG